MDFETATPREIDEALAALNWDWSRKLSHAHGDLDWKARNRDRAILYADTLGQMVEAQRIVEEATAAYMTLVAERDAATKPHRDAYAARRWSRYWIVANTNGHVHLSDVDCSTCFPTTEYNWMPQLSGLSTEEMVAIMGETACTVCYPDAPTMKGFEDGTSYVAKASAAAKAEKAAAKAERAATKAAKAITDVDGSPLKDVDMPHRRWRDTYKTLRSAQIALTDAIFSAWLYENTRDEFVANAQHLSKAIAAKLDKREDEVLFDHIAKANKKIKKQGGHPIVSLDCLY